MSRYKGMSSKGNVTLEDLAEIEDCYRRIRRIISSLNIHSSATLPLMATSATLKACWTELSGKGMAWSFPDTAVQTPSSDQPPVQGAMKRIGVPGDWVTIDPSPDSTSSG